MFINNYSAIPYELIVTPNMVANVESDVNYSISEHAFIEFLHISHLLAVQHKVRRYNKNYSNGFTIVTKEENGAYAYQVAVCNKRDLFDRRKGRYFALVRVQKHGWVDVPAEAIAYAGDDHYKKQLAVVDYFIRTVHNSTPIEYVKVKGSPIKIDLRDFNKAYLATFEDILTSMVGVPGIRVQYETNKHTNQIFARLVATSLAGKSEDEVQALRTFLRSTPVGSVPITKAGLKNRWYDRYKALYELLILLSNKEV